MRIVIFYFNNGLVLAHGRKGKSSEKFLGNILVPPKTVQGVVPVPTFLWLLKAWLCKDKLNAAVATILDVMGSINDM